jgi:hypothetical protein
MTRVRLRALVALAFGLGTAAAAHAQTRSASPGAIADSGATLALYAAPGAPLDAKSFRFARTIPSGNGLTTLYLDAAALAHSRVADVRIVDAGGRQVPYLLEHVDAPYVVALAAPTPTAARPDADARLGTAAASRSWYRVALPYDGLPDVALRLNTSARVFSRQIDVLTRDLPRDAQPDAIFGRAVTGTWAHDDPDSDAPPLELALGGRLPGDSLFVLVTDGDNQRLPLTRAALLLPTYRLRFYRPPGTSLTLLYGRDDLGAPTYDLERVSGRLLQALAQEVVAAPESAPPAPKADSAKTLFWAALGFAVLILLAIIVRLVRSASTGEESTAS